MRKKIVATLLSTAMVAAMAAGCGSKPAETEAPATEAAVETEAATEAAETEAPTESAETEATETEAATEAAETEAAGDTAVAGGNYHFEVVVKSFQSSYWQAALVGMDQAKDELGITYNATGPNAESDIADQVNMLNNAINQAPDGIALAACDQSAVLDSLQTALDKKIPVVCFDTSVPEAPAGSVISTVVTDNGAAGALAGEKIYEAVKDQIDAATAPVRIGEVNQDATSANISERGMGFINKVIELAKADGKTVAVVGNDFFVGQVTDNAAEADADIILEVAVPAQTTVELCSTEASKIMNESDTIAIFGSNQTAAEGVLTANQNLNVLGADGTIVGAGFDAGATIKAAVSDGTFIGAVTQSPLMMGKIALETLTQICNGENVEENIPTDGYWYDATTMEEADIAPNLYD